MYCGNCGTLVEESKFCSKCGLEINKIIEKDGNEESIEEILNELPNYNEINEVQEEKKEMTKKEIKQMKILEKKMANLNKRFNEDQELISKYLIVESRSIGVRNIGAIITMINVMAFENSILGGIGWGMILLSMAFYAAYYLTKCKRNMSIVLSIVFSIGFVFVLGILLSLGETYFGDGY